MAEQLTFNQWEVGSIPTGGTDSYCATLRVMKYCKKCDTLKPLDDFASNKSKKDGKQVQCRSCKKKTDAVFFQANKEKANERNRATRLRLTKRVQDLKRVPCTDCGNSYDPVAMDFDHVADDKMYNISDLVRSLAPWSRIEQEIEKCEVVCAVCHRLRTKTRLCSSIWQNN